ncbi:MAG: hypothetical protein NZ866_01830 [Patescibacteria group bacterium]|nr:hypothetical protein [Patescibacteria group bacterium]
MLSDLIINFHHYFSLFICLILIFINLFFQKIKINFSLIIILILSFLFLQALIISYLQYLAFSAHPISKFLLPPYQPLSEYFLNYVIYHYFKESIFRISGGILNLIFVILLNFIFKATLFYKEEYYLIFIGSILVSFPLNIAILPLGLFLILIIHLKRFLIAKNSLFNKISLKNYWLLICFFLIIINIILNLSDFNFKLKDLLLNLTP